MAALIETLRSAGFGAMLGGGIAGLIFLIYPKAFPAATSIETVASVGALVGGGGHQLIEAWVMQIVLYPMGRFVLYYARLLQLYLLRQVIDPEHRKELLKRLTNRYFLGGD